MCLSYSTVYIYSVNFTVIFRTIAKILQIYCWGILIWTGMAHSDCGWTWGCAGKTVRSLENTCHTWALLRWWFTKRRYIKCTFTFITVQGARRALVGGGGGSVSSGRRHVVVSQRHIEVELMTWNGLMRVTQIDRRYISAMLNIRRTCHQRRLVNRCAFRHWNSSLNRPAWASLLCPRP